LGSDVYEHLKDIEGLEVPEPSEDLTWKPKMVQPRTPPPEKWYKCEYVEGEGGPKPRKCGETFKKYRCPACRKDIPVVDAYGFGHILCPHHHQWREHKRETEAWAPPPKSLKRRRLGLMGRGEMPGEFPENLDRKLQALISH
jgi:hypothetical protein